MAKRDNGKAFKFKKSADPTGADDINPKKLLELTMLGDFNMVRDYIYDYPTSLDMKEPDHGSVALHVAGSRGNLELITLFHNRGANFNAQDMYGNTPLHYAVDRARREASGLMIQLGSNINKQDFRGNTPLHTAATNNDFEMCKILLKAHAEPEMRDMQGMTPAEKTTLKSIKELIERQIRLNDGGDMEETTKTVQFMSFGVGLGVGMGMALARQQAMLMGGPAGDGHSQVLEMDHHSNGTMNNRPSNSRSNSNELVVPSSRMGSSQAPSRVMTPADRVADDRNAHNADTQRKFL